MALWTTNVGREAENITRQKCVVTLNAQKVMAETAVSILFWIPH